MKRWDIAKQILDLDAANTDVLIQSRLKEIGWIKNPVIDYIATDSPDPRDAYTVRINGHVVGIHSQEESARNHAQALGRYIEDTQ